MYAKSQEELKLLQTAEKNFEKLREQAVKDCQKAVKDCQKVSAALKAELTKLKQARNTIVAEQEDLKKEVISIKENIAVCEEQSKDGE